MPIQKIDTSLCNGCKKCLDACPMDIFRLDTIVEERGEFPSCRMACPADVDMRSYLYMLKDGRIEEAISVLRDALPFPAVTGRICPHPCESDCARKDVDDAMNINTLERFLGDYFLKEKAEPVRTIYAAKTAIVGSGPAGLACAYFLVQKGYPVTVFEAEPTLGGMLRMGIPEYRLPKDVLDSQIDYIKDLGVEFRSGIRIGKDKSLEELTSEYGAVFFATGNQLSRTIEIDGAEVAGVKWGLDFLRDTNLGTLSKVPDRVVVIGGGNVAIDVALTARRLGARNVQVACLEPREEMPAYEEEIKQALEESIEIYPSWGPTRVLSQDGIITGIELARCTEIFNEKGRLNPTLDCKETKVLETGMVVFAVGQAPDLSCIPSDIQITDKSTIRVDPITMETTATGIFAGGDIVSGSSSVVEAIAAGKRTAISIDRYHKGEDLKKGRYLKPKRITKPPRDGISETIRQESSYLPVDKRGISDEVNLGFDRWTAHLEAQRCMTCGSRAIISYPEDCMLCLYCEVDCPVNAIFVSPEKTTQPIFAWG